MATANDACLLVVSMTIQKEHEAAFNTWYEHDYIPAFVKDIPGVTLGRRFRSLSPDAQGVHTYLTIYEFADEAALHKGLEVMRERESWRALWKEWEGKAVATISDGLYKTTCRIVG